MNVDRLNELATWLENGAKHEKITFDMRTGISVIPTAFDPDKPTDCGTVCCIAGAAVQFFDRNWVEYRLSNFHPFMGEGDEEGDLLHQNQLDGWPSVFNVARNLLDIDSLQASALFAPGGAGPSMFSGNLEDYNDPAWAARTIRRFIATGEVNWEEAR